MKYICLSYLGPVNWETMPESERKASMEEFFAYESEMRKNGHIIGGEGLQSAKNAATLRFQDGKLIVTDGPYAETKEQLAGFWIVEARDLNHAIQIDVKKPGAQRGRHRDSASGRLRRNALRTSAPARNGKLSMTRGRRMPRARRPGVGAVILSERTDRSLLFPLSGPLVADGASLSVCWR
jgi:hypothetical protein